ncbi:substrate-binding domain-containing protein [Salinisphaera sp.]|uniref:substrate-binding domain-containing protein n=1 Tax=Salinisphaera sp. TaxID=1914330 RepID=UPI002D79BDB9|nr:substrate-binding domain-containing protein [Salinisphaera sp.]HET7315035.1 substrate-binding domain-containing protein [Salinisphaera sp.]
MVVGDITNPFYPEVIDKLTKRLSLQKLNVMLVNVLEGARAEDALAPLFQYRVKAAIFVALSLTSRACDLCRRNDVPIILFNRYIDDPRVLKIVCDNVNAGRLIAKTLSDAGHRKLVYIAGSTDTSTNRDRKVGFTEMLLERGDCECVLENAGAYSYEAGHQAGLRLVRENRSMDAIFCANDIVAMGVMDALRYGGGVRIPEDVSVVGFDDIAAARWPAYDLTTVRQPVDRMIEMMAAKLESYSRSRCLIENDNLMRVPGQFIARSSAKLSQVQTKD